MENIDRSERFHFPDRVACSTSKLGVLLMKKQPILMNPHLVVQQNYTRLGYDVIVRYFRAISPVVTRRGNRLCWGVTIGRIIRSAMQWNTGNSATCLAN